MIWRQPWITFYVTIIVKISRIEIRFYVFLWKKRKEKKRIVVQKRISYVSIKIIIRKISIILM